MSGNQVRKSSLDLQPSGGDAAALPRPMIIFIFFLPPPLA
jgi:hypothetical protein